MVCSIAAHGLGPRDAIQNIDSGALGYIVSLMMAAELSVREHFRSVINGDERLLEENNASINSAARIRSSML